MSAEKRLHTAKRLMDVRKNQHLLSQLQVDAMTRAANALAVQREALETAEAQEEGNQGAYADILRQQVRTTHAKLHVTKQEREEREKALRAHSQKVEQTKPFIRQFEQLVQQQDESHALDNLVEQIAAGHAASLDQA
jgi:hypothetical protein